MKVRTLLAVLFLSSCAIGAQQPSTSGPIIWRDPGAIEHKDLFKGNTDPSRAPQPPFTFVREKMNGSTAKVVVRDARGFDWDVKLAGEEAHGEVIFSRLLWAVGYPVQENYYIASGHIQGARDLSPRTQLVLENGDFQAARFRRRDKLTKELQGWPLDTNPFTGSKELSGLIIMNALVNNWDTEGAKNQEVLEVKLPNGAVETWYAMTDLGAAFGRFEWPGQPKKWDAKEFVKESLIERVEPDAIVLNYKAFGKPITRIPLDHARWFAGLLGRLTDAQIRAAFKAGGAADWEIDAYATKIGQKIRELATAVNQPTRQ